MNESNPPRRRALIVISTVFGLAALAWLAWWWLVLSKRETTSDAYVAGNQVTVSAKIQGTVVELLADDTSRVEAGQVLLRLDPADTQVALSRAAATLAQTVRQVRQQSASAAQFDAMIDSRKVELQLAESQLARRQPLLEEQAIAIEELRQSETSVAVARAALRAAERQASAAHALVEGTPVQQNPAVLEARAGFQQAWLAARRSSIQAPVAGYVARRTVQIGQQVQPGQTLLSVVELDKVWVDANFKESQLRSLRLGQPVKLTADIYGSAVEYHGKVAGVSAGTGAAFSLLPAQNASGNWVKVVQRVPVRIELDPAELTSNPLRLGLSMSIDVDTHDRTGPVLAATANRQTVASTDLYADSAAAAQAAADAIIRDAVNQR